MSQLSAAPAIVGSRRPSPIATTLRMPLSPRCPEPDAPALAVPPVRSTAGHNAREKGGRRSAQELVQALAGGLAMLLAQMPAHGGKRCRQYGGVVGEAQDRQEVRHGISREKEV